MIEIVKYSFDSFLNSFPFPRRALKKTLPPIPKSKPNEKTIFHKGAMTALAAEPSGPAYFPITMESTLP